MARGKKSPLSLTKRSSIGSIPLAGGDPDKPMFKHHQTLELDIRKIENGKAWHEFINQAWVHSIPRFFKLLRSYRLAHPDEIS